MEIKLLTWNVNYWQNLHKEELREYLNRCEFDFLLLQEARSDVYLPPELPKDYLGVTNIPYKDKKISWDIIYKNYELHYHEIPYTQVKPFGSIIVSKKHSSIKNHFMPEKYYSFSSNSFGSTFLCYDYKVADNTITLINVYRTPRHDLNKFNDIINDIELITKMNHDNHLIVLAGDFNISTQPTREYPNGFPGAHSIFDRIHELGFKNCTMEKYEKHIQTIKRVDYQDDYIFINKPYKKGQDDINVRNDKIISRLSDHYQLELKYKL
jgi:exonuclease III